MNCLNSPHHYTWKHKYTVPLTQKLCEIDRYGKQTTVALLYLILDLLFGVVFECCYKT